MAEEHEHRTEDEVLDEQEGISDLDVPEGHQEDVAGGTGGSGGDDRLTESITLN